jgi:hypothetical protein
VLLTFGSSESSKEVHSGSIEAFAKLLFLAIANIKCCTLSFSRCSPLAIKSFDRWTSSSISRSYDAVTPPCHLFCNRTHDTETSRADHCRAPCCLHRIPRWLNDRYSPAAVIKGNPYPEPPMRKLHFCPSSASPPLLFWL